MKKWNDQSSKRKARRKGRTPLVARHISPRMALRASTDFELVEAVRGQQLVGVPVHQQSTLNHQLPKGSGHGFGLRATDTQPVGKWIERFEEWLADGGFLKKS